MNYLLIGIMLAAAAVSFPMEKRRRLAQPGSRPYRWGIFLGVQLTLIGCVAGVGAAVLAFSLPDSGYEPLGWYVMFAAAYGGAGFYVLQRYRWAWVVGTVLSINPVFWIANVQYGRNRWSEMRTLPAPRLTLDPASNHLPDNNIARVASEIRALDALRRDGLISDEEFVAKKTQLLGVGESHA
jgi:hypothetical protein